MITSDIITTAGVKIGKILKKKKVFFIRIKTIKIIKTLLEIWYGPKIT